MEHVKFWETFPKIWNNLLRPSQKVEIPKILKISCSIWTLSWSKSPIELKSCHAENEIAVAAEPFQCSQRFFYLFWDRNLPSPQLFGPVTKRQVQKIRRFTYYSARKALSWVLGSVLIFLFFVSHLICKISLSPRYLWCLDGWVVSTSNSKLVAQCSFPVGRVSIIFSFFFFFPWSK